MKGNVLVYSMIYAGSIIMLLNIILYIHFEKYLIDYLGVDINRASMRIPIGLLVMFLAGYLYVALLGKPDFMVGAILFGGSLFVLIVLRLIRALTTRIRNTEELRRKLGEEQDANRAKTVFLSNMSHDIRTPLNAIIGYSEASRSRQTTHEEAMDYLEKIESSGTQLLELIDDVLEMSSIESGRFELDLVPTDLEEMMNDISELFAPQMTLKGIDFTADMSNLSERYVSCDKVKIKRIILNLLSNSYKFTGSDGKVEVILRDSEREGYTHEISVSDTGIGMSPEFAEKVFEAFERERNSTVSGIQGTGLGMAITKTFVDRMDGEIKLQTEEGVGTTFTVFLNLEKCDRSELEEDELSAEHLDSISFDGRRVLLVEDVRVNMELASMLLSDMGFTVETAENGRKAVDMIENNPSDYFDVVLMDIQMPVMNGYEAAGAVRELQDEKKRSLPIIALTANAFKEDRERALGAGMDEFITKPLDPKEMKIKLDRIL